MKRKIRLFLASMILATMGVSQGAEATDQDDALRLQESGEILPLPTILRNAQAIQRGKLLEAEIRQENGVRIYELEIYGDDGRYYDLKFDARTGKLLKREVD